MERNVRLKRKWSTRVCLEVGNSTVSVRPNFCVENFIINQLRVSLKIISNQRRHRALVSSLKKNISALKSLFRAEHKHF